MADMPLAALTEATQVAWIVCGFGYFSAQDAGQERRNAAPPLAGRAAFKSHSCQGTTETILLKSAARKRLLAKPNVLLLRRLLHGDY